MHETFQLVLRLHIAAGVIGLVALWIPLAARKGGPLHRGAGRMFAAAMLFTGASAMLLALLSLADPLGTHPAAQDAVRVRSFSGAFLGYLGLLTVAASWMGWRALKFRDRHPDFRRSPDLALNLALFACAAAVLALGVAQERPPFVGLAVVGLILGPSNLAYMLRPRRRPRAWLYQHFSSMLGAGIGAYTAFLVVGAPRVWPGVEAGVLLWIGPTVVGTAAIVALNLYYRLHDGARAPSPAAVPGL